MKSRLPSIYRATSISCDPKGINFGVLQVCPNAELSDLPEIESSNMKNDFRTLLAETEEFDPLHDLTIVVGETKFFAHKLIMACSCEKMSKLVRPDEDTVHIDPSVGPETFEHLLSFIYSRSCNFLQAKAENGQSQNGNSGSKKSDRNSVLKVSGDPGKVAAFSVYSKNGLNSEKSSKKSGKGCQKAEAGSKRAKSPPEAFNLLSSLVEASRLFGLTNLTKILTDKNLKPQNLLLRFNRKSFPEFHDVIIRTEDGVEIPAHRCVLAARLDYFK